MIIYQGSFQQYTTTKTGRLERAKLPAYENQKTFMIADVIELLDSTERLLTEATSNLDKLRSMGDEERLEKVLLLSDKCNEADQEVHSYKTRLLKILVKIAVSIPKWQYDKVDRLGRGYHIQGSRIGFSTEPSQLGPVSILDFVTDSRECLPNSFDFNAFCKAIVESAKEHLEKTSKRAVVETTELLDLVQILEKKYKADIDSLFAMRVAKESSRDEASQELIEKIYEDLKVSGKSEYDKKIIAKAIEYIIFKTVRKNIIEKKARPDKRAVD